ncbi:hypothetical protein IFM89_002583 [Coptis chinensis]|uniref:Uncharacterized protein n=1 Tax=Coptis chinensis TaxID=261450 RepID=A0A835HAE8_9MAGN|nr:hypothetical protein IFM89_002583 [Coptis chinensis]
MEAILVEVLLEEAASGGKKADNGWRTESLKRTADEINRQLNMTLVSDVREQSNGGGDGSQAGESSPGVGDGSQADSGVKSTTPTAKKSKKSRFFEDIHESPSFKVFTEAVVEKAKSFKAPVKPI